MIVIDTLSFCVGTTHRTNDMKNLKLEGNSSKLAPAMNASKRKQAALSEQDNLAARPTKRHRGRTSEISDTLSHKNEHLNRPKTQYSRKARASSSLHSATEINFNAVPDSHHTTKPSVPPSATTRAIRAKRESAKEIDPSKPIRRTRGSERKKVVEPKVPQALEVKAPKTPKRKAKNSKNAKAKATSLKELTEKTEMTPPHLDEHELAEPMVCPTSIILYTRQLT